MCMLCKCKMIKNSFTTHVVNYSNSVILYLLTLFLSEKTGKRFQSIAFLSE